MKPAAVVAGALALGLAVMVAVVAVGAVLVGVSDAACGPGAPVPASADLDRATLGAINVLKPLYEQVAGEKDVAWSLLAAIDYEENGNDPNASALSGEALGTPNPDNPSVTTTSKLDSLQQAADHMRGIAADVYGVNLTAASAGDDVKYALLARARGYIYKRANVGPDAVPYVMNNFDDAHMNMVWPTVAGEPLAGMTDTRPGAFTVFARLGGPTASACGGLSANNIVAIAQQQLGLGEQPKGCNCGPQIQKFLGSDAGQEWCADFVSWVYWQAGAAFSGGADGGWRLAGVAGIRQGLIEHGAWHDRAAGDVPQPGDVVAFAGDSHVGIVERVDGTTLATIEGNSSDQVTRRSYAGYDADGEIAGWGRPVTVAGAPAAMSTVAASPMAA